MESAKAPENSSMVTEKALHLPAPKVFFSKSKSQISATVSPLDNEPHMSASCTATETLKSGSDESGKLCIGSHVIVGGVKEGILRFLGRVHFMEGDWCGVELDEPEGLHDGTVEQVRYFTCKSGHGIFAPKSKVALMHDRNSLNQRSIFRQQARSGGDAESQFKHEHSGSLENISSTLEVGEPAQVREKSAKPSKLARPRSVVSTIDIDLKEALMQSKLPRPKSAVVCSVHADSNPDAGLQVRRSSLLDYASLAKQQRASPKRVTFEDRVECNLSSSHISAAKLRKSDLQGEGYTSDEGSYESMTPHARFDPYMALTLTYDLESSPPRRKTKAIMKSEGLKRPVDKIKITTLETEKSDSIQFAPELERLNRITSAGSVGSSNQGSTEQLLRDIFDKMDEEISNIPTPDTAEIQMIIPDSLSSSEEDARRMFSSDGRNLTVTLPQKKYIQLESDHRPIKYSAAINDERSREMRGGRAVIEESLEGTHSEDHGLKMGTASVMSNNMGGELQALKKKASFELARTALAQYADLIRAAQEDRTHRLAKASVKLKPQSYPTLDPSLEEPCTTEPLLEEQAGSFQGDFFDPSWSKDRTDQVKAFEDVELSDSVDSLNVDLNESLSSTHRDGLDEYETFEGEDLRTIKADDVIVIDSDEEFIEGERLAISGELGLDDSLIIDSQPLISKPVQHPAAVSDGFQDVDGNLADLASVPVHPEITGQISEEDWNNTINNMRQYESEASTLVPLVSLRRKQQSRPVSMVSTASSDAGIVDDLLPSYGLKHERPISLISSTSSTDTGCPMEVDSDMLSSTMLSSTLDDLAESWQEPGSAITTANWLTSYAEPDLQDKAKGEELLDYPVSDPPGDAHFSHKVCITGVDSGVIKDKNDQKGLEAGELCSENLLDGIAKDVIRTKLLEKEIDLTMKAEEDPSYEKMDSVVIKLESDSIQKDSSTGAYLDVSLSSKASFNSSEDDLRIQSAQGLSCAEVSQKASEVSALVENSLKSMVSGAEEQPDVGCSSENYNNLCSGQEPVLAKVLAVNSETPAAHLVGYRDLQVYMVSEDSGFAAGKLSNSEDTGFLGNEGSSRNVQLKDKHTEARETEPEHLSIYTNESSMEEKGDKNKPELENTSACVTESHNDGNESFSVCQTNLFVETTVNSEEAKLDDTFTTREKLGVNDVIPESENIQLRENCLNKGETLPEDTVKTMSDEKNGQEEVLAQSGQKMNTGLASVSICKEIIEDIDKEISHLEEKSELLNKGLIEEGFLESALKQEPDLMDSLQKVDKDYSIKMKKEDDNNVGEGKEKTDDFDDAVAKQGMMAVVSDDLSSICFSEVMAGSGTAQEAIIFDSCMSTAIGTASKSALGNDSLAETSGSTEAMSEVVEIELVQISGANKKANDTSDIQSGLAENNTLSEMLKPIAAPLGITEDHEIVTGFSEIGKTVLELVEGDDTVSEVARDSDTLLQFIENSDIMSESRARETVDKRLLEQVRDTEGSCDVMHQTKSASQNHGNKGSSGAQSDDNENRKQATKDALKSVILIPDRNEEENEIAKMTTENTNDATGYSETIGKVTVNQQKKTVSEKDVVDGRNVTKGMRNGHTKAPSKLMVRRNVRNEIPETLGQAKTKRGKADDSRDSKGDSVVGNGKAGQKAYNVSKSTKAASDSITGKYETLSGNTKLKKMSSDVGKMTKDDSGAENGNARRSFPNSSRNVKSDSAIMKNVKDNVTISRSQSDVDRNAKSAPDTMGGSVSARQAAVKNQNKDPRPESLTDFKEHGKKKSASVSESTDVAIGYDLGASASESSEIDNTSRDKKSGNFVKLSVLQNTSTAKISGAKAGAKSKQGKEKESSSGPFSGKRKISNGDLIKDDKPLKATFSKAGGLNTTAPAKRSGASTATLAPLSDRSVGRKSLNSQETLADAKAEGTQGNVKLGIGRKNPGSALVFQKRGSLNPGIEGKGRLSNAANIVRAVPDEKASILMLSRKDPIKTVAMNDLSNSRASSLQSTKAPPQSVKPNVAQGSSSSSVVSKRRIPKPGSAAGLNDGDKTIPIKQTKESEALKSSSKMPSAIISKDVKSKADSNSQLTLQVNELKLQLKQTQQQLEEVIKERGELQLKVSQVKEVQASEIRDIRQKHQQEIDSLKKVFVEQTKTEIEKVIDQHSHEVRTLKSYHDRHLSEAKQEHRISLEARDKEFQDTIAKLKAEHLKELNETKASHEQQLNEISERFEEIKISLSSKVEQLRSKCDELCSRELCYKDTCKRESDLREQAALEVDSLRVVLEQRNGEIRKLRQQNALLDEKVQEIPALKERITKLQQSIENLEAVNDLKSGHEKQLADMHQVLLRKFERESKAMKRLSMENEELMWRLSQSDFGPSCLQEKFLPALSGVSLMSRSYDSQQAATMIHRTRSNTDANQEATMSKSYHGFSDFYASTPKAVSSQEAGVQSAHSSSSSSSASGGSHSQRVKLRRSGTYEVMDQENFEHKP